MTKKHRIVFLLVIPLLGLLCLIQNCRDQAQPGIKESKLNKFAARETKENTNEKIAEGNSDGTSEKENTDSNTEVSTNYQSEQNDQGVQQQQDEQNRVNTSSCLEMTRGTEKNSGEVDRDQDSLSSFSKFSIVSKSDFLNPYRCEESEIKDGIDGAMLTQVTILADLAKLENASGPGDFGEYSIYKPENTRMIAFSGRILSGLESPYSFTLNDYPTVESYKDAETLNEGSGTSKSFIKSFIKFKSGDVHFSTEQNAYFYFSTPTHFADGSMRTARVTVHGDILVGYLLRNTSCAELNKYKKCSNNSDGIIKNEQNNQDVTEEQGILSEQVGVNNKYDRNKNGGFREISLSSKEDFSDLVFCRDNVQQGNDAPPLTSVTIYKPESGVPRDLRRGEFDKYTVYKPKNTTFMSVSANTLQSNHSYTLTYTPENYETVATYEKYLATGLAGVTHHTHIGVPLIFQPDDPDYSKETLTYLYLGIPLNEPIEAMKLSTIQTNYYLADTSCVKLKVDFTLQPILNRLNTTE